MSKQSRKQKVHGEQELCSPKKWRARIILPKNGSGRTMLPQEWGVGIVLLQEWREGTMLSQEYGVGIMLLPRMGSSRTILLKNGEYELCSPEQESYFPKNGEQELNPPPQEWGATKPCCPKMGSRNYASQHSMVPRNGPRSGEWQKSWPRPNSKLWTAWEKPDKGAIVESNPAK